MKIVSDVYKIIPSKHFKGDWSKCEYEGVVNNNLFVGDWYCFKYVKERKEYICIFSPAEKVRNIYSYVVPYTARQEFILIGKPQSIDSFPTMKPWIDSHSHNTNK